MLREKLFPVLIALLLFPLAVIMGSYTGGLINATYTSPISSMSYPNTWWLSVGGTADDQAWSGIYVDEYGYIYCTGYTKTWKPLGHSSLFLVKNGRYGENVRSILVYGNGTLYGRDVVVVNGDIYVVGQITGYGAGSLDGFIVKLKDSGEVEWFNTIGGSSGDLFWSLSTGYNNTFYATGYTFSYGAGKNDAFIVKTDSEGRVLWAIALGGSLYDYGWSIDTFTNGTSDYVVVGGQTKSYGGIGGGYDAFVALLSGEGMVQWIIVLGTPELDAIWSVAFDDNGYIYVAGNTKNTSTSKYDAFVAKFSLNGELQWITSFGGNDSEIAYGVAVDENYVYVAGYTASYTTGLAGEEDVFIAALDKYTGEVLTFMNFGGPDTDYGYAIAVDDEYIYVTGKTGSFTEGGKDLFQIKFSKDFIFDPQAPDLMWVYNDFPEDVNTSLVDVPLSYPSFNVSSVAMEIEYVTPVVNIYPIPGMLIGPVAHLATATGEPPAEITTTTVTETTTITNTTTVTVTETITETTTETTTETVTETTTETYTVIETETVTETINQTITETTTVTETVTETQTQTITYTTTETETVTSNVTQTITETKTETFTTTTTETVTTPTTVTETVTDMTMTAIVGIILLIIGIAIGHFALRSVSK